MLRLLPLAWNTHVTPRCCATCRTTLDARLRWMLQCTSTRSWCAVHCGCLLSAHALLHYMGRLLVGWRGSWGRAGSDNQCHARLPDGLRLLCSWFYGAGCHAADPGTLHLHVACLQVVVGRQGDQLLTSEAGDVTRWAAFIVQCLTLLQAAKCSTGSA